MNTYSTPNERTSMEVHYNPDDAVAEAQALNALTTDEPYVAVQVTERPERWVVGKRVEAA